MLNARHSFTLLWKRLVAALSLAAAATLTPAAAPAGGAAAIGSRVGSGTAVASSTGAAGSLAAGVAAGLVEGGQHRLPFGTPGDPDAKILVPPLRREIAVLGPEPAPPPLDAGGLPPTHAARAGLTRAPPAV